MKIDDQVERLTRLALDAAVKRDLDKLGDAVRAFPDDETARQAVELALAVSVFIMLEIHDGRPDDGQIRAVAEKVADMEQWAEPTVDEIHTFLSRILTGQRFAPAVPPENVVVLAFVVGASLLASLHLKGEKWWNYLDRVEAAIESAQ